MSCTYAIATSRTACSCETCKACLDDQRALPQLKFVLVKGSGSRVYRFRGLGECVKG